MLTFACPTLVWSWFPSLKSNTKHKKQKESAKEAPPWNGQSLNMFDSTKLTLMSDVDQDKNSCLVWMKDL